MPQPVRILDHAIAEARAAFLWYREHSTAAAERFRDEFARDLARLRRRDGEITFKCSPVRRSWTSRYRELCLAAQASKAAKFIFASQDCHPADS
jgi:hypothetical protein